MTGRSSRKTQTPEMWTAAESSLAWARWNAPDEHEAGTRIFLSTQVSFCGKPPLTAPGFSDPMSYKPEWNRDKVFYRLRHKEICDGGFLFAFSLKRRCRMTVRSRRMRCLYCKTVILQINTSSVFCLRQNPASSAVIVIRSLRLRDNLAWVLLTKSKIWTTPHQGEAFFQNLC